MAAPYDADMQLGYYDVPAAVLAAAGVPLAELIGKQGVPPVAPIVG
jgi:hypothetical protein